MYLHLYLSNNFCSKFKNILIDPLKTKLINRENNKNIFFRLYNSIFSQEYRLKKIIYKSYLVEQRIIKKNNQNILDELNSLNMDFFHKKYNNTLMSYLIDLISDYYELDEGGIEENSLYLEKLMSFFYMNELLFYISNENVNFIKKVDKICIVPKENQIKYLKRRWFAYTWEQESKLTNNGQIEIFLNQDIQEDKLVTYVELLADSMMDKIFFMHPEYVSLSNKKKEQYIFIYSLCKFFLLLKLIEKGTIYREDKTFRQLGLTDKFLDEVELLQKQQVQLDKGFNFIENTFILDNTLDLYHILKAYLIKKYQSKLSNISAQFGKIFEESIKQYASVNFSNDYKVIIDNIDYHNVDIDMTLYDKRRDFYYFIQIKYAVSNKPYLRDEIKGICNNKTIKKGIKQLEGFHHALKDDAFKKLLHEKKINLKEGNFSLILLHTISQFDFHEINNIQLYEWNTFRNLLQRGRQSHVEIQSDELIHTSLQNNNTLRLENVDRIIQLTMDNANKEYDLLWHNFINGHFSFTLNDKLFESNIK